MGRFHLLAAVNIGVKICLSPCFNYFGYILRNGVAGPYGSSIVNFLRNFHTAIVAVPIYTPTNSAQEFPFLCIPANTFVFCFFQQQPYSGVRRHLTVVLICASYMTAFIEIGSPTYTAQVSGSTLSPS